MSFCADGKSVEQLNSEMLEAVSNIDSEDKIVLLRAEGTLSSGKPSEIDFKDVFAKLDKAYFVMKNTSKLVSAEFEGAKTDAKCSEEIENELISALDAKAYFQEENIKEVVSKLIAVLDKEKAEGEKNADFEKRIVDDALRVLDIKEPL